jgi:hypothetical protein
MSLIRMDGRKLHNQVRATYYGKSIYGIMFVGMG